MVLWLDYCASWLDTPFIASCWNVSEETFGGRGSGSGIKVRDTLRVLQQCGTRCLSASLSKSIVHYSHDCRRAKCKTKTKTGVTALKQLQRVMEADVCTDWLSCISLSSDKPTDVDLLVWIWAYFSSASLGCLQIHPTIQRQADFVDWNCPTYFPEMWVNGVCVFALWWTRDQRRWKDGWHKASIWVSNNDNDIYPFISAKIMLEEIWNHIFSELFQNRFPFNYFPTIQLPLMLIYL